MRKEFDEKYRDSVLDPLQKFGHTLLCLLFIAETIVAAQAIEHLRHYALEAPGDTTLGIMNAFWVVICKRLALGSCFSLKNRLVEALWELFLKEEALSLKEQRVFLKENDLVHAIFGVQGWIRLALGTSLP